MRGDLDAGLIELRWRSHPGKLSDQFRPISAEGLAEVLVLIRLPDNPGDVVVWDGSEYIRVRVFRIAPAVGDGADEKPASDEQVDEDSSSASGKRGRGRTSRKDEIRKAIKKLNKEDINFKDKSKSDMIEDIKKEVVKVKPWDGEKGLGRMVMYQVLSEPLIKKIILNK